MRRSRRKTVFKLRFSFNDIEQCIDNPGGGACFQWSILQWLRRQDQPFVNNPALEKLRQGLREGKGKLAIPLPTADCANQAKLKKGPLQTWHGILKKEAAQLAKGHSDTDVLPQVSIDGYLSSVGDTWGQLSKALKQGGAYRWADREVAQLTANILGRDIDVSFIGGDDDMCGSLPTPEQASFLESNFPSHVVCSTGEGSGKPPIRLALLYGKCEEDESELGAVQGLHWQLFKDEVVAAGSCPHGPEPASPETGAAASAKADSGAAGVKGDAFDLGDMAAALAASQAEAEQQALEAAIAASLASSEGEQGGSTVSEEVIAQAKDAVLVAEDKLSEAEAVRLSLELSGKRKASLGYRKASAQVTLKRNAVRFAEKALRDLLEA